MSTIDPSIIQGLRPAPPIQPVQMANPLDMYAKAQQAQYLGSQNQMAQQQIGITNAMGQLYKEGIIDGAGNIDNAKLQTSNDPMIGAALMKVAPVIMTMNKQRADIGLAQASTSKAQQQTLQAALQQVGGQITAIDPTDPTSLQQFLKIHYGVHQSPVLGPLLQQLGTDPEGSVQQATTAYQEGTAAWSKFLAQSAKGALTVQQALKNLPITKVNTGPTTSLVSTSAYGPSNPQVVDTLQNSVAPDTAATVGATERGQDIGATTTRRGQDIASTTSLTKENLGASNTELSGLYATARAAVPAIARNNEVMSLLPHAINGLASEKRATWARIGELVGVPAGQDSTNSQIVSKYLNQNILSQMNSLKGTRGGAKLAEIIKTASANGDMSPAAIQTVLKQMNTQYRYGIQTYSARRSQWSQKVGNLSSYPDMSFPPAGIMPSDLVHSTSGMTVGTVFTGKGGIHYRWNGGNPNSQSSYEKVQ